MDVKALLHNAELHNRLQEDGFITIPFLNEEELEMARSLYHKEHPGDAIPRLIDGIHMTSWCPDLNYKLRIKENLEKCTRRQSQMVFQDFRSINHVFIIKVSGKHTTFKVHQDWNVIDETKYSSVNVWIPLYDVDAESGGLWIVPGSHKINRPIRGAGYLFPDYSGHLDLLENASVEQNLKAGEAVIFFHSVIHGSPPNLGARPRIAVAFSIIPEEAPLNIYFQKTSTEPLEVHRPPDDFMYHYENLRHDTIEEGPTRMPFKKLAPYKSKPISLQEIQHLLPEEEKSLFGLIKKYLERVL